MTVNNEHAGDSHRSISSDIYREAFALKDWRKPRKNLRIIDVPASIRKPLPHSSLTCSSIQYTTSYKLNVLVYFSFNLLLDLSKNIR
jgi:hypothetical protein